MRYTLLSFIILLLFYSPDAEAQTDVKILRKDFKAGKSGFDVAWKHITNGDLYYSDGGVWYGNAFDEYTMASAYNNSNAQLNYKTGVSALFSEHKAEAAAFLIKASKLKNDVADDILILTGRALQYAGRFPEAIAMFNSFLISPVKKQDNVIALANKCIEECVSAIEITKDTLSVTISNLGGNINSSEDDYSEILTADGKIMYFASRRQLPESGQRSKDSEFDENIFISNGNSDSWSPAITAGKNINSGFCETPLFINTAGDQLFIYAGYENGGDIKVAVAKKGEWKAPDPVGYPVNTSGSETSFCISPSGNEIYYVTDNGKDGRGRKDIYFIKKISEKKWSKPQNAGEIVNTPYDEESVRFSKSGDTLFFSSKGHNSIGGFDIFYSVKNSAGEWGNVKNYGYPVNTQYDELFYFPIPDNDSMFLFVSNRSGGMGGLDIYRGKKR